MRDNRTTNGRFIHYAVEYVSPDGAYVAAVCCNLDVAITVLKGCSRTDEYGTYYPGRIIPYESGEDVWIGFPFHHMGAKRAVAPCALQHGRDLVSTVLTDLQEKEFFASVDDVLTEWSYADA